MIALVVFVVVLVAESLCQDAQLVLRPPFTARPITYDPPSVDCKSYPSGWMIPRGFCLRYYTLCVLGRAVQVDCRVVAQAANPGLFVDPNAWAFDGERKLCVPFSTCTRGSDWTTLPPTVVLPSITPPPPTVGCVPGVRISSGQCSSVFLQCSSKGVFEPRLCPSKSIFDSTFRVCLYNVPQCSRIQPQLATDLSSSRTLDETQQSKGDSQSLLSTSQEIASQSKKVYPQSKPTAIYGSSSHHSRIPPRSYAAPQFRWYYPQHGGYQNDFDDFYPKRYEMSGRRSIDAFDWENNF